MDFRKLSLLSLHPGSRDFLAPPSPAPVNEIPARKVISQMPARSGRIEKRIRLKVSVQISSLKDPDATERTTTENVCSLGVRILSQRFRASNERLMISSFVSDLRTLAQVVYCQRLPDGRFGVGLQLQGQPINWPSSSLGGATA